MFSADYQVHAKVLFIEVTEKQAQMNRKVKNIITGKTPAYCLSTLKFF